MVNTSSICFSQKRILTDLFFKGPSKHESESKVKILYFIDQMLVFSMPNTTTVNDVMSQVIEINCKNSLCQSEYGFERNSIFDACCTYFTRIIKLTFESDISERVLKRY